MAPECWSNSSLILKVATTWSLPVRTRDYRIAKSWLGQLRGTLRTLDALHLAVAEAAAASTLTADRRLAAEAQALGLPNKLLASKMSPNPHYS